MFRCSAAVLLRMFAMGGKEFLCGRMTLKASQPTRTRQKVLLLDRERER